MLIIKALLLLIILVGMIVLLLSVRLLAEPNESADAEDLSRLRHDLEVESGVITSNSLFNRFLARGRKK